MKLEDIGFYTLSDRRAMNTSPTSPLMRCELVLTERCNFNCPYCRGLRSDCAGDMPRDVAMSVVDEWIKHGLKNVRFTGGEPTLYPHLEDLVKRCSSGGVNRIALSTNGSASWSKYSRLLDIGVSDFSISLDGGCCSIGDAMSGGAKGAWNKVVENIRRLSAETYVSVGMVFTEQNVSQAVETVMLAHSLGVSDIRVVPSAQFNQALCNLSELPDYVLAKYPILKYRIDGIKQGRHVRGLQPGDCSTCWLGLDDIAVVSRWHFPCIIHLREGGDPIGGAGPNMRNERAEWVANHNAFKDPICVANCLDVCRDYNAKVAAFKAKEARDANS